MYNRPCRCGKIKKNFKHDIGPFFMGDCCFEAGYDIYGYKEGQKAPKKRQINRNPEEIKTKSSLYCLDCGKPISKRSVRCRRCAIKKNRELVGR